LPISGLKHFPFEKRTLFLKAVSKILVTHTGGSQY
jgi:hypothetical protein